MYLCADGYGRKAGSIYLDGIHAEGKFLAVDHAGSIGGENVAIMRSFAAYCDSHMGGRPCRIGDDHTQFTCVHLGQQTPSRTYYQQA